jgi:hypothetical protein
MNDADATSGGGPPGGSLEMTGQGGGSSSSSLRRRCGSLRSHLENTLYLRGGSGNDRLKPAAAIRLSWSGFSSSKDFSARNTSSTRTTVPLSRRRSVGSFATARQSEAHDASNARRSATLRLTSQATSWGESGAHDTGDTTWLADWGRLFNSGCVLFISKLRNWRLPAKPGGSNCKVTRVAGSGSLIGSYRVPVGELALAILPRNRVNAGTDLDATGL